MLLDLERLYSIDPSVIRKMPSKNSVIVNKSGALGLSEFPCRAWRKEGKEDILTRVGIKVEYGEPVERGQSRGSQGTTIDDREHA